MYKLIIAIALVCLASADHINKDAETRSYTNDVLENGFNYAFDTSNGINVQASGDANSVHGSASWVSLEGTPVQFSYVADENGYQPQSEWLPTPPPVPEYVLKALEYIRSHPPQS